MSVRNCGRDRGADKGSAEAEIVTELSNTRDLRDLGGFLSAQIKAPIGTKLQRSGWLGKTRLKTWRGKSSSTAKLGIIIKSGGVWGSISHRWGLGRGMRSPAQAGVSEDGRGEDGRGEGGRGEGGRGEDGAVLWLSPSVSALSKSHENGTAKALGAGLG